MPVRNEPHRMALHSLSHPGSRLGAQDSEAGASGNCVPKLELGNEKQTFGDFEAFGNTGIGEKNR
uniref:Uncharacterized protein n=1 Tax=Candidatus Kentrum sp. DK TaxID=2126562 RepID=A0A450RVI6_9GAMM|nr:MAG: hypothetical protein BECKDK2373C_GA0170839_100332 [Candidatus Kentron sp. DK]